MRGASALVGPEIHRWRQRDGRTMRLPTKRIQTWQRHNQAAGAANFKKTAQYAKQVLFISNKEHVVVNPRLKVFSQRSEAFFDFLSKISSRVATSLRCACWHNHPIWRHEREERLAPRMKWSLPVPAAEVYRSEGLGTSSLH